MDDLSTDKQDEICVGNNQISTHIIEKDNGFQCNKYFFTYHFNREKEDIKQIFDSLKPLKSLCIKYIWAKNLVNWALHRIFRDVLY